MSLKQDSAKETTTSGTGVATLTEKPDYARFADAFAAGALCAYVLVDRSSLALGAGNAPLKAISQPADK